MSDEERDIDIESDDDESLGTARGEFQFASQAEKRAHHNALERKRRDHIKDSFCSLRDSVPSLQGEKASRAQILKKAADYIEFMRRKNSAHQQDIDDLKKQNNLLENQIRHRGREVSPDQDLPKQQLHMRDSAQPGVRSLEKTKYTGNFAAMTSNNSLLSSKGGSLVEFDGSGSETSDSEASNSVCRKKLKT
ncbi:protein max-like isoform X2 [Eriocheir sinensis]|uniref:protein max-like isoform X2 n=1 Tax=Eriocheir sinensis TaxID=95602 RepID=UPI0021C6EE33|nr:protein max-like isoform X2 [Eriocheir sinensis]